VILWLAAPVVVVVAVAGGMMAISRHYQVPKVPHRRNPGAFAIPFEEIHFPTAKHKTLYGWWIPAGPRDFSSPPTVILVHGWSRNVQRVLPFIRKLHPAGFNLLAFDARSHGSSDDDGTANMLKFSEDIRSAVDEAIRRGADPARIGLLGLSVGGAASIHAAARDHRIRALVTIGAFAHPGDLMRNELHQRRIPDLFIPLVMRYVEHSVGARLDEIAPEANIGKITVPFLLVHGEQDAIVPVEQGRRLAAAAGENVDALFLPTRGHSNCDRDPAFWPRVFKLFSATFPRRDGISSR